MAEAVRAVSPSMREEQAADTPEAVPREEVALPFVPPSPGYGGPHRDSGSLGGSSRIPTYAG